MASIQLVELGFDALFQTRACGVGGGMLGCGGCKGAAFDFTMNTFHRHDFRSLRGFTLVEVMVSVGVLAVMIPVVVAAMIAASHDSARARAENRAPAIVGVCLGEVGAANGKRGAWLEPIPRTGEFPAEGLAVIGFTDEGRPVGRIKGDAYQRGVRKLDGRAVRYLARIEGVPEAVRADARQMRSLRIVVEYPAGVPAGRRRQLEFVSRVP
jgi:prepilin-type N-terminal cleavage/methylation domain-containing protein